MVDYHETAKEKKERERTAMISLRERIRGGDVVFGTFLFEIAHPAIPKILAGAGFDFVIVDMEHGTYTVESSAIIAAAARAASITPLVRVAEASRTNVLRSLEGGACGIMLPSIRCRSDVEALYTLSKYPPEGERGVTFGTAHTDYKFVDVQTYLRQANDNTLLLGQIETLQALENLDDILASGALDVAFVGPYDLSVALGVPGNINAPSVQVAMQRVLDRCQVHGVTPGIFVMNAAVGQKVVAQGFRFVACSSELFMMMNHSGSIVRELSAA